MVGTGTRWWSLVAVSALFLTSQGTHFKNSVFLHAFSNVEQAKEEQPGLFSLLVNSHTRIEAHFAVRKHCEGNSEKHLGSEPRNKRWRLFDTIKMHKVWQI